MYAIRSYYGQGHHHILGDSDDQLYASAHVRHIFRATGEVVITSYSIHYTKLYDRNNGARRAFASRRRDGEYCADRESLVNRLALKKVPKVTVVNGTCRDRLGGIDDAATAYGEDEIDVFPTAKLFV